MVKHFLNQNNKERFMYVVSRTYDAYLNDQKSFIASINFQLLC